MKFDDILVEIGEFGTYQKRLYVLLCLSGIPVACFMMQLVFVMETPKFRCQIPGLENDRYSEMGINHSLLVQKYIPQRDGCHVYRYQQDQNSSKYLDSEGTNMTVAMLKIHANASRDECTKWVYDTEMFTETYTSHNNLICEKKGLPAHARMVFFFGVLSGDLVFGALSDIIGRKKAILVGYIVLIASSFAVSWMPTFIIFCIMEFIIGASSHGMYIICNVMAQEITGPKKRKYSGTIFHLFFSIGLCYQTLLMYLLREWKSFNIAIACSSVIMPLIYFWLLPESPRWLISKERYKEAHDIIQRAAEVNGAKLSEHTLDYANLEKDKSEGHIWQLCSSGRLFFQSFVLNFNWMMVSFMYYGVTMHGGNIGDFYLNFLLMGLIEFPSIIASIFLIDKIGRKKTQLLWMLSGGIACLCTIFTVLYGGKSLQPLTVLLATIGKMGSAAGFAVVYILSVELYPTVVRNAALGFGSAFARVGSMMAPYCASVGSYVEGDLGKALPLVIFGGTSVLAGLLCLYLPETLNQKLPETIEDGINFGRKPKTNGKKAVEENSDSEMKLMNGNFAETNLEGVQPD
ncbi:hypothetical protein FSP39_004982 [Pinctada imbricata]|uniref:Major facilitator superfamily (MFS) profile domain-containing protein n=1 Tax=Pinctada imbricata TaxID=66713 RepID=A0AA89BHN5_PINIB|nr:hypothetical protein FSP39_004982 [Pinctada imbricata]